VKKFIATTVLASSILFPTLASAENASFPVKMTVQKKVEIRKGATTAYPIVKSLDSGQQVTVTGEFTNSTGEKWVHVDLGDSMGWGISTMFANSTAVQYATVIESNVNIRKGATVSYQVIGTLSNGTKVKVIDSFQNSIGEKWYRIESGNLIGWVEADFLKTDATATASDTQPPTTTEMTVYTDKAIVHKGATTAYPSVGTLTKDQMVTVLATFTNASGEQWFRIQSGSLIGWVMGAALDPNSTSTDVLQQQPTQVGKTLLVGTKNAVLYKGATYNYSVVEKIPYYSKVTVLNEFVNSKNQTWLQIKTPTGKTGWTPQYELVQSTADLSYVYALNRSVIRKGASATYAVSLYLKENDKLLTLQEVNGWVNVETSTGKRGWILKNQTSPISLKRLISPTTYVDGEDSYLVWQKPIDFNFTYSATANQLKLTQGITDVELPSFNVAGIQSINTVQSSTNEKSVILTFAPGYTFTLRNYNNKVSIKVLPTGMLGKKIIIDAGHGGKDTGAIGPNGLREKDANLGTALLVKTELENAGAIVTLTRSTDIFLELSQRTDIANMSDADAFISIHSDSFSTTSTGTTTYYNTSVNFNGPRSRLLGQSIQEKLYASLSTYDRGVKEQDFYVNRMNELPSVLVELAYISNPKEEALLRSNDFRQKAAIGVRQGLEDYFNNF
jgi:N-acetylmuramoyl-L-alanine amidase